MPSKKLCRTSQLPGPGLLLEFTLDGQPICVANDGVRLAAVEGLCPHRGAPLAEGNLLDGEILCPWHAWKFDLSTGLESTGCESIKVYALEICDEQVFIQLPG